MNGSEVPDEIVDRFAACVLAPGTAEFQVQAAAVQAELRQRRVPMRCILAVLPDETLALAFQKRFFPSEAFTELYNRHWQRVGCWLVRFGAEANEAFDLAQGVFLNFYRLGLRTYDPQQSFVAYLRRAAYHFWIARAVRPRRPDLTPDLDAGPAPGCVEDEAVRRELQGRLDDALARLPDLERRIMEQTLEGQKPAAIATLLGVPTPRVFRLLWKARNTLAAELKIHRPPTNRGRKPRRERPDSESPNA